MNKNSRHHPFNLHVLNFCEEDPELGNLLGTVGMGSTSTKENSPANTLREAVLYESVFESSLEGDNSFCEPGTICTDCVRKNTNICLYDDGSPLYEFECQLKV